ncbi:heavy-metal-associated domain-containing protein [Oceanotoga sp. DSM 15011]|uniref:Copper chaperone n=1 Tax=Oceanotoga teriensis TaxID=515440 RepID=A0AA45C4U0_9BACT|nr:MULTISPECIES: heavy-metal-associated domain-containing protein [Oceanotoga]MDN5341864.1 copper chaperone [Oceanotoga sp.]MDO7976655.1 heavy-metal-associated domain-containing protein [Oceanotoga teriensis]PWJ87015.1 copper chaperone [Oceanotoga teriensis]UYP00698.1 heavy-metal-associated domain-containing protein [Oceanotoga sp. DSM 15011]
MKYSYDVPDMSCNHCKMNIENALKEEKKISKFEVDLPSKKVHVETEEPSELVEKILEEAGYPARIII